LKVLFSIFFISSTAIASVPVVFTDYHDVQDVRGVFMDFFEDTTHALTIQDIVNGPTSKAFKTGKNLEVVLNDNFKATYWVRIKVINRSSRTTNWVAELYDFRIENVDVYTEHSSGITFVSQGGANFPFSKKLYQHKNFIYNLSLDRNDSITLYYKIRADKQVSIIGRIRSYEKLLEYSNLEYFCLALFYGIMLAMIFYNLFLFLALADVNYFYYVMYVASVGVYLLNNDGLGFQYLWPRHPSWNDYIFPIADFSMTLFALMYGKSFLSKSLSHHKWIFPGFTLFMIMKTIVFMVWIYYPSLANVIWIDVIPFLYIYAAGIISFVSGNRMARFYVLAFTLFFAGFIVSILRHFQLVADNLFTVYSFNYGVLSEMVLLSFALADRIKMLTQEKEKDLEETVNERSHELERKNKELDNFVYRSSHDIKGPIKSVIGLASLGVNEKDADISKEYFNHILKSSKKLDQIVNHLLTVIEIKESKLKIVKIDLKQLLSKVISKLEGVAGFDAVKMYVNIEDGADFNSDKTICFSALENILEHCLCNYDPFKERAIIKVNIHALTQKMLITITDNGLGNNEEFSSENMVEMLYNMNIGSSGAGFALYKAKIFIDKLDGSMVVKSKVGSGTFISIVIKNQQPVQENGMESTPLPKTGKNPA
jgi:signal transduction histidine kinase